MNYRILLIIITALISTNSYAKTCTQSSIPKCCSIEKDFTNTKFYATQCSCRGLNENDCKARINLCSWNANAKIQAICSNITTAQLCNKNSSCNWFEDTSKVGKCTALLCGAKPCHKLSKYQIDNVRPDCKKFHLSNSCSCQNENDLLKFCPCQNSKIMCQQTQGCSWNYFYKECKKHTGINLQSSSTKISSNFLLSVATPIIFSLLSYFIQ